MSSFGVTPSAREAMYMSITSVSSALPASWETSISSVLTSLRALHHHVGHVVGMWQHWQG